MRVEGISIAILCPEDDHSFQSWCPFCSLLYSYYVNHSCNHSISLFLPFISYDLFLIHCCILSPPFQIPFPSSFTKQQRNMLKSFYLESGRLRIMLQGFPCLIQHKSQQLLRMYSHYETDVDYL